MKIVTTQIRGLLERIAESQEENIEETARLLAQAAAGEGHILIAAFGEMKAVESEAVDGAEPLAKARRYDALPDSADRVWIIARDADHPEALRLARELADRFIPFSLLTADSGTGELAELATTAVSTGLKKGLLPGPDGTRIVQPHALAALFVFETVKLAMDEMLRDE